MSVAHLASTVLRSPEALLDAADDPAAFAALVPRLVAITAGSAAIFGVVVGSYRGGLQILYAGTKMPLLLLVPLLVALPAVRALLAIDDPGVSYARVALAGLVGTARTAILAAALGPVVWLFYSSGLDYHLSVLLLAATLAVAGLPGLAVLGRAVPRTGVRRVVGMAGSALVFAVLLAQSGWLLRPFVVRPQAEIAFLRPVEADVFSSLGTTAASAGGVYGEWTPARRGLLARPEVER